MYGLLTHQCTKYSKINVGTIAKRLMFTFPVVNGNFVIKFGLHKFTHKIKMFSCYWLLIFLFLMKNTLNSGDIILNLDNCNPSTMHLKC